MVGDCISHDTHVWYCRRGCDMGWRGGMLLQGWNKSGKIVESTQTRLVLSASMQVSGLVWCERGILMYLASWMWNSSGEVEVVGAAEEGQSWNDRLGLGSPNQFEGDVGHEWVLHWRVQRKARENWSFEGQTEVTWHPPALGVTLPTSC